MQTFSSIGSLSQRIGLGMLLALIMVSCSSDDQQVARFVADLFGDQTCTDIDRSPAPFDMAARPPLHWDRCPRDLFWSGPLAIQSPAHRTTPIAHRGHPRPGRRHPHVAVV
jgi:hypothetical protein